MLAYKVVKVCYGGHHNKHRYSCLIGGDCERLYTPGNSVMFDPAFGTAFANIVNAEEFALAAYAINITSGPYSFIGVELWEADVDMKGKISAVLPFRSVGRVKTITHIDEWWQLGEWQHNASYPHTHNAPSGSIACSRIRLVEMVSKLTKNMEHWRREDGSL